MGLITDIISRRNRAMVEKSLGRKLHKTEWREVWIPVSSGVKLCAHIHKPVDAPGKTPGLVFVPGGGSAGTEYDKKGEVSAVEAAGLGLTVMSYDPSGRGKTGGVEDYWGTRHQKEFSEALAFFAALPEVDENDVGVISFSIGVTIAAGALARFPSARVRYLYDWEGPSSRKITTKNDTHKPLIRFPSSDSAFWDEREAAAFIGGVECVYFRYQALIDHVQGESKSHAVEMVNNATRGRARWTRLNDNPKNTLIDESRLSEYHWVQPERNNRATMLEYLLQIHETA